MQVWSPTMEYKLYLLLGEQEKKGKSVFEYWLPSLPLINSVVHFGRITTSTYLRFFILVNVSHFLLLHKTSFCDSTLNRMSNRAGTQYFLSIRNWKISGQLQLPPCLRRPMDGSAKVFAFSESYCGMTVRNHTIVDDSLQMIFTTLLGLRLISLPWSHWI